MSSNGRADRGASGTPIDELGMDKFDWERAVISTGGPPRGTTRLVLLTLAVFMNREQAYGGSWECFPSIRTIARGARVSERTVCTHLEIAEQTGWVQKLRFRSSGQGWRRHEYVPCLPTDAEPDSTPKHRGAEPGSVSLPVKALNIVQYHVSQGAERRSASNGYLDRRTDRGAKGTESGSEGTEPDEVKVLNDVQSTNQLPTITKHSTNRANARHSPSVAEGETPASTPPEIDDLNFDTHEVLQQAVQKLSAVPSLNTERARQCIRRWAVEIGLDALVPFLAGLPQDPKECLVYIAKRPRTTAAA